MKSRFQIILVCLCAASLSPLFSQALFPNDAFDCHTEMTQLSKTESLDNIFNEYQILKLDATALSKHLRSKDNTAKNVNFRLGTDKNFGLVVRAHEMRTPDFVLMIGDDKGKKIYPRGENTTYSARFEDKTKECSRLTIDDDFIQGFIQDGNDYVYIEPARFYIKSAPRNTFVVYRQKDVKRTTTDFCAFDQEEWQRAQSEIKAQTQLRSPCSAGKQVELAVAADFQSYTNKGSIEDTKNYIFAINNAMELKYYTGIFTISGSATDISFTIKTFYIATSAASNPYSPLTTSDDGGVRLSNFGTWGAANFGVTYDLSQVWTGINIQSGGSYGVAGIASTPGVCSATTSNRKQIDEDGSTGTSVAVMEQIVAHETGHNFNSPHDGSAGACPTAESGGAKYLMNPSVDGDPIRTWSPCTKGVVQTYTEGISCLGNCTTIAAPVADFIAQPKIACANNSVAFTDLSTNEPTSWNWVFTDGTPATATSSAPSAVWTSVGNYTVSMASTNSLGTSATQTKTNYIKITSAATDPCAPTGTNLGNNGINSVSLANISKTTGSSAVDGSNYMNFACTNVAYLSPNTTYSLGVNIGSSASATYSAVRVWINYNDNSSFGDAGELVYTTDGLGGGNSCWQGTMNSSFITPASSSITMNRMLRMRVWANCSGGTNPCGSHTSSSGQIEDYAVYFSSVLPVELLSFSGKWEKSYSALVWSTASEKQNSGFEIQRSFDGTTFEKVGLVKSKGESTQTQNYWFNDYTLATTPQYIYYRLKQIDENGDYTFSKIIAITPENLSDFKIYPNPTKEAEVRILYEGLNEENIHIEWLDMMGRVQYAISKQVTKGQNILDTNISSLGNGVYFVRIRPDNANNQTLKAIRFVKL